jgi:hypothetical protein
MNVSAAESSPKPRGEQRWDHRLFGIVWGIPIGIAIARLLVWHSEARWTLHLAFLISVILASSIDSLIDRLSRSRSRPQKQTGPVCGQCGITLRPGSARCHFCEWSVPRLTEPAAANKGAVNS